MANLAEAWKNSQLGVPQAMVMLPFIPFNLEVLQYAWHDCSNAPYLQKSVSVCLPKHNLLITTFTGF